MSQLTEQLKQVLSTRQTDDSFDFAEAVSEVLSAANFKISDAGGNLSFSGRDPLLPTSLKLGNAAAVVLAAKAIAASLIWRNRGGDAQNIHIDVRKALKRFNGFFDGKYEQVNGRPPSLKWNRTNPFFSLPMFRPTKDGRHVVALNIYPTLHTKALALLNCSDTTTAINEAISKWNADDLENAAAEAGVVIAKVRTTEEFLAESQYTDVLANMPLISIEKIADGEPVPFSPNPEQPLSGIRALGYGHVIAGAGMGRDMASFGADVLNCWLADDVEVEPFYWDAQVGMRSTYLGEKERPKFLDLLKDADVFFSNRHPGYIEQQGLTAEALSKGHKGLIHAQVLLHGADGPWKYRPGFDEIGGCVSGCFTVDGSAGHPAELPSVPLVDNLVGWLGGIGIMSALQRRAKEGGSYRVRVSLTRTCLWLQTLGLFDLEYAKKIASSSPEHTPQEPDLFTAETPLGHYQGLTDQIEFTSLKQAFKTVLEPMGANRPEWLS